MIFLDKLEGASAYQREKSHNKVSVTNINGVTVIGEGNVVNTQYTDAAPVLSELEQQLAEMYLCNGSTSRWDRRRNDYQSLDSPHRNDGLTAVNRVRNPPQTP